MTPQLPCSGCASLCKPCTNQLGDFQKKEKSRKKVDPVETILEIDESAEGIRSDLITLKEKISKQGVAPTGAFIFKKTIKKPSGKNYEYWFVRGYNPEKETHEKSLGSTKGTSKELKSYRARIDRRDQIQAIDFRLSQIEDYLTTSKLHPLLAARLESKEVKDDES